MAEPLLVARHRSPLAPLADACVTEWRWVICGVIDGEEAPLADACVTEWRMDRPDRRHILKPAPLADACVTEWRLRQRTVPPLNRLRHSLMLVLLNGGW